jgi:cytidylate kinase
LYQARLNRLNTRVQAVVVEKMNKKELNRNKWNNPEYRRGQNIQHQKLSIYNLVDKQTHMKEIRPSLVRLLGLQGGGFEFIAGG